ncbi:MAG: AAC(3) family N-acetyltransferase [Chloroflexi bacterium]|nr:AAC(3) family N-acetyltransferase [Ardenticatenaceae bacterium]MBL1129435.1 aminoglycoside N(3)-acetyltransferase [Chloroflexota bacterium]NOG35515.1 AAC(3) family N-acetyltransferase [Chloroflexota bacterium]
MMVHASFKALGIKEPGLVLMALGEVLRDAGALLMPALSYRQQSSDVPDTNWTPTCVGFLSEYFRWRPETVRSLHPTHSVCGVGAQLSAWLGDHLEDCTPCGPHSPFYKILHAPGKILMLGCGLAPNTARKRPQFSICPAVVDKSTPTKGKVGLRRLGPAHEGGLRPLLVQIYLPH